MTKGRKYTYVSNARSIWYFIKQYRYKDLGSRSRSSKGVAWIFLFFASYTSWRLHFFDIPTQLSTSPYLHFCPWNLWKCHPQPHLPTFLLLGSVAMDPSYFELSHWLYQFSRLQGSNYDHLHCAGKEKQADGAKKSAQFSRGQVSVTVFICGG